MAKSITQIRDEISNFYLSIQNEVTDVSTGSVAGGLIYAFSAALQQLYTDLDDLESQAYIATATGRYLDLLIEGGFFLPRPGATRSVGYVVVYGDSPIVDPGLTGSKLICADYDYSTGQFIANLSAATKFTGTNSSGSSTVTYALIRPQNSSFVRLDSAGRSVIDLKTKKAQYLILPVASVVSGSQSNVVEGALNTFSNPPTELRYVLNVNNPGEIIFDYGGVSTAPLFSRNTSMNSLSPSGVFSVVNAFNFSTRGFLEISYKSFSPTTLLSAVYQNSFGDEISGGLVFEYDTKTQTSITLTESQSYIKLFNENELIPYDLISFTYENVIYSVDASDVWTANQNTTLSLDGTPIGPSTPVSGSAEFFRKFFGTDNWVLQQRREQVSDDIIFDPDNALTDAYSLREAFRLTTARDAFSDTQYRRFFRDYINSLPRATASSLEFAALNVSGISFAKTLPAEFSPTGTAVLLAAADNGVLSLSQKQAVIDYIKDDWLAAGVNLIVRSPDLVNFSMAVSVSLTTSDLEQFVRRSIRDAIEGYLASKRPGDELKYGDIYSIIASINGVKNVSKLVIGKNEPAHYINYKENYALVALNKAVEYSDGAYEEYVTPVFREATNDITISSDINGVQVTPVQFSQYENFITSKNIFSEFNQNVYGAVFGIFASDGGDSINAGDYTTTLYPEIFISEEAILGLRFTVDATDASISINVNGQSIISTDVAAERVLFIPIPSVSSDVTITFAQEAGVTISEIQTFLHTESIDTCYVAEINSLSSLSFIDASRIEIVYGMERKSNRIKNIKTLFSNSLDAGKLKDLILALVTSSNLSVFQSILRDYQFGTNVSGKNNQFFKDVFVDTTQILEIFRHFLTYATTSPLSTEFDASYPLNPENASNNLISDYKLSETEISRFKQLSVRLPTRAEPTLGILVE
jgi:uncharacterized phage protein gp47/JayE